MIRFAPVARRYLLALRLSNVGLLIMAISVLTGLLLPVNGWVFAGLVCAVLICVIVVAATAFYLGDFTCPQCGLLGSCRRHGRARALDWCVNCGLSLKEVAAADR